MNWHKFRENRHRWGFMRALHIMIMGRLARVGIEINAINVRELVEKREGPYVVDGIEYQLAGAAELKHHAQDHELQMTAEFIDSAFAKGDLCCAAFEDGRLISYAWRSGVGARHVPGVSVEVGAGTRYGYKAFTRSEYRGRGIYPRLSGIADNEFLRRGKTKIVAFTATHNYASLRSDRKLGNRIVGFAGFWKIGSRCLLFHTPSVKSRGFRFVKV